MSHIITTQVEQELDHITCIKTKENFIPKLSLKITFQLNHDHIEWHNYPSAEIVFIEIINLSTNQIIVFEDLPIIAQINARKKCREYLEHNQLDNYYNIIPFNSYPYRMSNPLNQNKSNVANIIPFINKSK